jgi:hypothetical protein
MFDPISEEVEYFGRAYLVRTEVIADEWPVVRSTVLLDGSVAGLRESPVEPSDASDHDIDAQVSSQHAQVIDNLRRRSIDVEGKTEPSGEPPPPEELPPWTAPLEISLPGLSTDPDLLAAVEVRRLIGPFSLALLPSSDHSPEAVLARLDNASAMVDEIIESPTFSEIRLDEQVRFSDLKQRLTAWHDNGRDLEECSRILLEMIVFAGHLRKINNRRELLAIDHTLLTWALFMIAPQGSGAEILPHLDPLRGRDADLDRMLDQPDTADREQLQEVLQRLLERTGPGTG